MTHGLEGIAEPDFKSCTAFEAFHLEVVSVLGFLLEYDVLVEQVGYFQFQTEMIIQLVAGHEIQGVYRQLLFISQSGDTDCVDTWSLQVIQQGSCQRLFVSDGRCVADIRVDQVRRSSLQGTLRIGVRASVFR